MSEVLLNLASGLRFFAGDGEAFLAPLSVRAGEWLAITPAEDAVVESAAPPLARLLATLGAPLGGSIELFGQPLPGLPYAELQRLRPRLGFVPCRGGLLSNRTLAENITLPLSVHAGLSAADEAARLAQILEAHDLVRVAHRRPDDVDGATRFRACVARALALRPSWLVIEGRGDFALGGVRSWQQLEAHRAAVPSALVACLAAPDPGFESWLQARGARILRYHPLAPGQTEAA